MNSILISYHNISIVMSVLWHIVTPFWIMMRYFRQSNPLAIFVDAGVAWNQILMCIGCIMAGNYSSRMTVMKFHSELLRVMGIMHARYVPLRSSHTHVSPLIWPHFTSVCTHRWFTWTYHRSRIYYGKRK